MMRSHSATLRAAWLSFIFFASSCAPSVPHRVAGDTATLEIAAAARLAYDRDEIPRAITLYREALDRARAIDSAAEIIESASNLAICQITVKNYGSADALLREADYDAARTSRSREEITLLRAKVAYLQVRVSDAMGLADEVIRSMAPDAIRFQAMTLKGQMYCDTPDIANAKSQLQSAAGIAAHRTMTPSLRAELKKLEGLIARAEKNNGQAARLFDSEAELLQQGRRYHDMCRALARAAESHLAAGEPALAADRFFLSGRATAGLGDVRGAKILLASSIAASKTAGDQATRVRSESLLKELNEAAGP